MNVLLTGGNGFLGRSVLPCLLDAGHSVTAVVRSPPAVPQQETVRERVRWVAGDLGDAALYSLLPRSMDAVIHCATRHAPSENRYDLLVHDNVLATCHLTRYAVDAGVKRFVYTSTLSVHGTVLTERVDAHTPIQDPCSYGVTKYTGERVLAEHALQLPAVALRLPGVIGLGAPPRLWLMRVLSSVLSNEEIPIYSPDASFNNAIHVADLVNFFARLLDKEWQGFYAMPLGASTALTVRQVVEFMIQRTASRSRIVIQKEEKHAFWVDSSLAEERFGFNPMTIEAILGRLVDEQIGQRQGPLY